MDQEEEFEQSEQEKPFQSFFVEAKEIDVIISSLAQETDVIPLQKKTDETIKIFEKYQEQGHLLDPHLENIVHKLMYLVEQLFKEDQPIETNQLLLRQSLFKILYVLTKVRGYKAILKQFPHDISHLELLFGIYTHIPSLEWETRYILLLWLSLIVINPFPFCAVDATPNSEASLTNRMINEAKKVLEEPGKPRDSAAIFLSRLLSRHDLSTQLKEFLEWTRERLASSNDSFLKSGILSTLVNIFKSGKREELIDKIGYVLPFAIAESSHGNNTLLRQLSVKLVQRIGLTYLKPRIVSWRYQKTRTSLIQNLSGKGETSAEHNQLNGNEECDDDIELPEQIEEIIEKLLNSLDDTDTIVRWSAAKGIGRITMRLPKHLGDEVVGSILALFDSGEGDSAWHGGCLALAELARRGLLLPSRLNDVIPVIIRALEYDERKGAHSVGAHVRDAACYVCWAFARAYAPNIMAPYVSSLAEGLIKTAVFDREVNCRRAAAAAFQENVGRQGNFPHGIEILTKADYFTLCNRNNAFLEVSYFIAQYPEYCHGMVDHLVKLKISHWDKSIRELSSKALRRLCGRDSRYMIETILPNLISSCYSPDLITRHGALLAVSEIMIGLYESGVVLDENLQFQLTEVVPTIETKRLYRGRGGEIIREGVCLFIESMALSKIYLPDITNYKASVGPRILKKKTVSIFQETLDTNLKHPNNQVIELAVRALKAFMAEYYNDNNLDYGKGVISNFIKVLRTDPNPATRRGYSLALGSIPKFLLDAHIFKDIYSLLIEKIKIEEDVELQDAESRRNAVFGLINICKTIGVSHEGVNESNADIIFEALIKATNDYAVDKRGDVGSFVREAAMEALQQWAVLLCSSTSHSHLFTAQMSKKLISAILKQAVEKIDRVRDHAGNILKYLLFSDKPVILNIAHKEELKNLIQQNETNTNLIDWSSAETTFPIFVNIIDFDEYRYELLSGFVVSAGGLSSHVFKHSSESLIKYLKGAIKSSRNDVLVKVCETMQSILKNYRMDDRVIVPLLKTLTNLLSHNCMDMITPDKYSFTEDVIASVALEVKETKNINKILICIDVLCELLRFENPTRRKAFQRLLVSGLMNKYPKAREYTGQQLFAMLQVSDGIVSEEKVDELLDILSTTKWTDKFDVIKPKVDRLFDLLSIEKIVMVKKAPVANSEKSKKQEDSYADLVRNEY